ncbi:hypothetical protein Q428_13965 [Fervidicella metallireducens AeB]|uniref:Rhodanese domain-containing protein n=1 Tax=Fervidicella metallireducens AeB TaxID=1403537 RepID=A0A017RS62_9CLOT|nr:tRNA 2-selenouridine(34) synthase MnmH [Fervidicella metallireducens]EYE87309.1 hypothetical protein Q428_13965 [Fervidicella metallireducens AeB]
MIKTIDYQEIDKQRTDNNYVLIDVRSEGEYKKERIPNSINIPLFNDEERKIIGTVYVKESVERAKELGVEAAAKKLPSIYKEIKDLDKKFNKLIFYCARGGMRSSSIVSLLSSLGVNVLKLSGGYKGYRKFINENLPEIVKKVNFAVLYGNTGVGKTKILQELEKRGYDVLDLESYANHRGSLLGSIRMGEQNSQKLFEAYVYDALRKRKSNTVFVEGESKRIGRIIIPDYLFTSMEKGKRIKIDTNMDVRIKNIMDEYVSDNDEELINTVNLLRIHLSDVNVDRYITEIKNKKYRVVIEELMTKYYDPMYNYKNKEFEIIVNGDNIQDATDKITEIIGIYK